MSEKFKSKIISFLLRQQVGISVDIYLLEPSVVLVVSSVQHVDERLGVVFVVGGTKRGRLQKQIKGKR